VDLGLRALFRLKKQDSIRNFRRLRKNGITVRKTIDAIIATFCIENNLPLLHSDKDFRPFHEHLKLKDAAGSYTFVAD